MRHLYVDIYNILITLLCNVDFRLYSQDVKQGNSLKQVIDLIKDVLALFDGSPFDGHFEKQYLIEQGELTVEQMHEVYDEF